MTDTTSTRPQMGDEELRRILTEEYDKAGLSVDAFHLEQGDTDPRDVAALAAMSRVRASLPQPTAGSTGEASSCKHEWLYATSKKSYDEGVFWGVPFSPTQYRECSQCSLQQTREWHSATASTPAQSVLVEALRKISERNPHVEEKDRFRSFVANIRSDEGDIARAALSHAPSQPAEDHHE